MTVQKSKKGKKPVVTSKSTNEEKSLYITDDYDSETIIDEIDDDDDRVWFNLTDMENLVANCFDNFEENSN
ncbi:3646_t:CDS:1, partial [Racocetra persica]